MLRTLALALVLPLPLAREESRPAPGHPVELRISPLVELWLEVRARSEEETPPPDEAWRAAVEAMRELGVALDGSFGIVEGNLVGVEDAVALHAAFAELPERFRSRGGAELELRAPCVEAAGAVAALEPAWRAERWPARRAALEVARGRLGALLDEHGAALHARLRRTLGLPSDGVDVPVYLVTQAPWPGAFTHRVRSGGGVCFVALEEDPSDLLEALVHETIHALDLATPGDPSLLAELRRELAAAGLGPGAVRDWVHTLFFLEAGACVRALVDPEHVDYGERTTLYARSRPHVDLERPLWRAWVAGELDRAGLVAALVAAARDVKGR